jgi:virginiamycin B lyase
MSRAVTFAWLHIVAFVQLYPTWGSDLRTRAEKEEFMRASTKILGLIVSVIFVASLAYGTTIKGTVKGPDGTPFRGAFVQTKNIKTKITVSVLSDGQGRYSVENLPAGEYQMQARAVGYKSDPRSGLNLVAQKNAAYDFTLQKGAVSWSDISVYQASRLFPQGIGRDAVFGTCFSCHAGFQTRLVSAGLDEAGWRERVNRMRQVYSYFFTAFTDQNADDAVSYLNTIFGRNSVLAPSPVELLAYKELLRSFSDEALKIVYVEYDLPRRDALPWGPALDKNGTVWIPYYGTANELVSLDPKTGEMQEFPAPNRGAAGAHSAVAAPDGTVWFTEQGSNKLGKWDPRTRKITEYQDEYAPAADGHVARPGSKLTIGIDSKGNVWTGGRPLSWFDPATTKFTHIEGPSTYQVLVDQQDNVWYSESLKGGAIGKVDGKTGKITKYSPPSPEFSPHRFAMDSQGMLWADGRIDKIVRFDPKTETFKEFTLPGPAASPYAVATDKNDYFWYSSNAMDTLGRLDAKTGQVIEYPFPYSQISMKQLRLDPQGRIWWVSDSNNKVGYFYLAGSESP